jgi:hypothetical protein
MKMEILLRRLSKRIFFTFSIILTLQTTSFAQDSLTLKKLVLNELILFDEFMDCNLFANATLNFENIRINRINSTPINFTISRNSNFYYDLIELDISLVNVHFQHANKNLDSNSRIIYYLINTEYNEYLKVFGFTTTNIHRLRHRFTDIHNYERFIIDFSGILSNKKILDKSGTKFYIRSLVKNYKYYPKKLKKPINVLSQLYPNRLYQTIILDYDWVKSNVMD